MLLAYHWWASSYCIIQTLLIPFLSFSRFSTRACLWPSKSEPLCWPISGTWMKTSGSPLFLTTTFGVCCFNVHVYHLSYECSALDVKNPKMLFCIVLLSKNVFATPRRWMWFLKFIRVHRLGFPLGDTPAWSPAFLKKWGWKSWILPQSIAILVQKIIQTRTRNPMRNSEPGISQNYHYWRDRLPGYSFPEWKCYSGSRWYLKSTSRPAKIPKQTIQRLSTTHQFKLKLQKTLQPPTPTPTPTNPQPPNSQAP